MWYFVIGYWIGSVALHYYTGNAEYGGSFAVTLMASLIALGFIRV